MMNLTQHDIERFWSNIHIGKPDECWEWQASSNSTGYGQFRIGSRTRGDRRVVRSHEVAFQIAYGYLPSDSGEVVRHSCDNKACCNPYHLLDGTQAANVADAVARSHLGRRPVKVPNPELVFQLKRQGFRQVDIAAQLGLSQQYVSHILLMKRRVPGARATRSGVTTV